MDQTHDEFFLLGFLENPYRSADKEHFWMGPFDSRRAASEAGLRKQKHGPSRNWVNWSQGRNRVFKGEEKFREEAMKVGLNPKI